MTGSLTRAWVVALIAGAALVVAVTSAGAQGPPQPMQPGPADSPTITVLTGLMVPQFETEMRQFVQALGVTCGGCHVRGNFASEDNPRKAKARQMIEMTKSLNQRFFQGYTPAEGESTLGRVTCYTCHHGGTTPKSAPAAVPER